MYRKNRVALLSLSISIIFCLSMAGFGYAKIDPKTCVGLWLFDKGTGDIAKDSSGTGNDGTVKNKPKWVNGKFGKALEFDGGLACVEVQDPKKLDLTEAVTVSMLLEVPADAERSFVLSKNDNKSGFRLEVKPTLYWCVEKGDALKCVTSGLPREEWVHLAGTFDGDESKLYVNGEQAGATLAAKDGLANAAKSLIIGAHRSAGDLPFNGIIDETAIFNVALEEEDIQDIMDKGLQAALGMAPVYPAGKLAAIWAAIKSQ